LSLLIVSLTVADQEKVMAKRFALLLSASMAASLAIAAGTGPTHPEKSREHPLDTREPRQDVIEGRDGNQAQPRPPTLETPEETAPTEPAEPSLQPGPSDPRSTGSGAPAAS